MQSEERLSWRQWIFAESSRTFLIASVLLLAAALLFLGDQANVLDLFGAPRHESGQLRAWVDLLADILKEFGFALLIAVVIIEGIERASRQKQNEEVKELIDKIKTSVLEAVYGTEIATVFFAPFRKIIDHQVLRKDGILTVDIAPLNANHDAALTDNDVVVIDITLTFDLLNCAKKDLEQKIPAYIEKPWPALEKLHVPDVGIMSIKVRPEGTSSYQPLEVKTEPAKSETNDLTEVVYKFDVPHGKSVTVVFAYRLLKYARDTSSFFTVVPTTRMRFDLSFDPRLKLFYTHVHADEFLDETPDKTVGRINLRSAGPLFPDNGIQFWWAPTIRAEQLDNGGVLNEVEVKLRENGDQAVQTLEKSG